MEEILHHQKDGWIPINSGMSTTYQLVQDFFHPIERYDAGFTH